MQIRRIHNPVLIAVLICLRGALALANPVVDTPYGFWYSDNVLIFVIGSALGIEYLIVSHGLQKHGIKRRQILWQFLVVNLFTVPITQMLGFCFSILAEIFPLAVEPVLYARFRGNSEIGAKSLTKLIVLANLISFGYGILFYGLFRCCRDERLE